jgi:hypothetical protein
MKHISLLLIVFALFSSCKKCDPSNSIGGAVLDNVIVRVPGNQPSAPIMVTNPNQVNYLIEASFDGGVNYSPVNFTQYTALAIPTVASCSSGYDRVVEIIQAQSTVKYTLTITECTTCEGTAQVQNWVLIPAVPGSYTPVFDVKKQ